MDDWLSPLKDYFEITTPYGAPVALGPDKGSAHKAVDIGAPSGTPLFSIGPGKVLEPNGNPEGVTAGNTITVDYGNGLILTFAHLDKIFVKPGDTVGAAQMIGTTGQSGLASGPHLHIDAWKDGTKINPLDLFDYTKDVDSSIYPSRPGISPFPNVGIGGAVGDAVDSVGDGLAAIGSFVAAVLNPENWARILAIFGGAVLALFGAYMVWQAT